MTTSSAPGKPVADDVRAMLRQAIAHLEHVLPGQAPIADFVHHNTLHGYQHLPFAEAVSAARRLTGIAGFLPEAQFRAHYHAGRIVREDLDAALQYTKGIELDTPLGDDAAIALSRRGILIASLLHPIKRQSRSQLRWLVHERGALESFQPDIDEATRQRLLASSDFTTPSAALADLWQACLESLDLAHATLHPEELVELSPEQVEAIAAGGEADAEPLSTRRDATPRPIRREADHLLRTMMARVGSDWTLRSLLLALTGEDIVDEARPEFVRHVANFLDQGVAAWHNPGQNGGLYAAWRRSAERDVSWLLGDLPEWRPYLERLPVDALETIVQELRLLGLPTERWARYLELLSLEIPGWAGMAHWRERHPGYGQSRLPVDMADFLAIRLVLERLYAQRLCRRHWRLEASLPVLRWYFRAHPAELVARHALTIGRLPEFLVSVGQRQRQEAPQQNEDTATLGWLKFARLINAWRHAPARDRRGNLSVAGDAWPLFHLCQALALPGHTVRALGRAGAEEMLRVARHLDADQRGYVWLVAYERHYREQIFAALTANHGRTHALAAPSAQLVFCMDEREEGMRRHVEETDPTLDTFGVAGFFGIAINWRGLDDETVTPLCPVVVTPAHEVREVAAPGQDKTQHDHQRRRALRIRFGDSLHHRTRAGIVRAAMFTGLTAPLAALVMLMKSFTPRLLGRIATALRESFDRRVPTRLLLQADAGSPPATPAAPRLGFTDEEQAVRVEGLLRMIGLTKHFAPLVMLVGHGSASQNNPHLAAYDCGACSGRHGGPNARIFAAMANRPEIRQRLAQRGITVPADTWFIGAEHNTCDDTVTCFDRDLVPHALLPALQQLEQTLAHAGRLHAIERCRRLASAPRAPAPKAAAAHVRARMFDFSQARPELGHVTNAAAFIGRRTMSRGAFFDRRAFLISYDPTIDPAGEIVEAILLAAGPVGAGISLEYYFSTVNNDRYGCGTKIVHNLTGRFGVMEGTSSDLRTGLPQQMIEIHEPMRLLVIVEHKTEVLTRIYERQPPLRELIGNGWVQLAAKDPDSAAIHVFEPGTGWIRWQAPKATLAMVERSPDWFAGHDQPLAPALIARAVTGG